MSTEPTDVLTPDGHEWGAVSNTGDYHLRADHGDRGRTVCGVKVRTRWFPPAVVLNPMIVCPSCLLWVQRQTGTAGL
ncbi:MAG: hypothetical protein ACR2PL_18635 [Dehalococcoidia bacterium]